MLGWYITCNLLAAVAIIRDALAVSLMLLFKLIIFAAVSVGIVFISRASLRDPHSHGFFRFFVFESILALILLKLEHWFSNPFSALQIVSWLILLSSLVLATHGFYLLRMMGRPKGGIENTTTLVMLGVSNYVRHPLYTSWLLLGWGYSFYAFIKTLFINLWNR
jgi:protein-S-isoprenylcysteine O-methyltransferase Ste14